MPFARVRTTVLTLWATATAGIPLAAQQAPENDSPAESVRSWSPEHLVFSVRAASTSTSSSWLGKTPDRGVFMTAVRAEWRIAGSARVAAGYFLEVVPAAVVSNNPDAILAPRDCIRQHPEWKDLPGIPLVEYFERCGTRTVNAFGAGFAPIGVAARFGKPGGIVIATELSAGGIVFNRTVPYPNATRFNYSLIGGTALELPVRGTVLIIGYQLQHLSNGGMGTFNPGIMAHALQLGWRRELTR